MAQNLQNFGEYPLAGKLPAVAQKPILSPLRRKPVDFVRFGLRGMVLPQFDPCVRLVRPCLREAERRSVAVNRQERTGGEIDSERRNIPPVRARLLQHLRDGFPQGPEIVGGMLQSKLRRKFPPVGEEFVHHAVRVDRHRLGNLAPILRVDQNGSCRKRAEVDPNDIPFHCLLPGYFRFAHSGQM